MHDIFVVALNLQTPTLLYTPQIPSLNSVISPTHCPDRANPPLTQRKIGPIEGPAGPGILPFFDGCGPFYRWAPANETLSTSATAEYAEMVPAVSNLVEAAVNRARVRGSKVVGVIGFSMGTRVVAGLLKASQMRRALQKEGVWGGPAWLDFSFGVTMCSSFPPLLVPAIAIEAVRTSGLDEARQKEILEARITIPALHVLGGEDEWLYAGKLLVQSAYEVDIQPMKQVEKGKNGVYEFKMGHQYPVEPKDTLKVANWIVGTWEGIKDSEVLENPA
jgi:hypothetical protein